MFMPSQQMRVKVVVTRFLQTFIMFTLVWPEFPFVVNYSMNSLGVL